MRVTILKPGTHMDSGLMFCVYQNQGQGLTGIMKAINMKLRTHIDSGLLYRVYQNRIATSTTSHSKKAV